MCEIIVIFWLVMFAISLLVIALLDIDAPERLGLIIVSAVIYFLIAGIQCTILNLNYPLL